MATARVNAEMVGSYERAITRHIHVDGSHWSYKGRLPLAEVRLFVASVFDEELPEGVRLVCVCDGYRCVAPAHQDWQL